MQVGAGRNQGFAEGKIKVPPPGGGEVSVCTLFSPEAACGTRRLRPASLRFFLKWPGG